jgi:hypothetical protein
MRSVDDGSIDVELSRRTIAGLIEGRGLLFEKEVEKEVGKEVGKEMDPGVGALYRAALHSMGGATPREPTRQERSLGGYLGIVAATGRSGKRASRAWLRR